VSLAQAKDTAQKRVAVYLCVSTGEQTTDNQRRELEEVATRHGWRVVEFFEDAAGRSSPVADAPIGPSAGGASGGW
jgi:hypothetical protein